MLKSQLVRTLHLRIFGKCGFLVCVFLGQPEFVRCMSNGFVRQSKHGSYEMIK